MPAKNREKIQLLGHFFGTLCLQGKIHPFFYKTGNGTSSIYRGAPCWGMAGGCLGRAQAPPGSLQQAAPPKSAPFSSI
ncbi:hypothetical protein MTR_0152s0130 [Medicago truncatula]|uniref:Uncharacterized protein n=1 Tax=Medicago truncatula TaxID=3880 RepID=A0A072TG51_MEDTR|nr:hypothetical protein MTR_0152s0130 [Medicago truncatula]